MDTIKCRNCDSDEFYTVSKIEIVTDEVCNIREYFRCNECNTLLPMVGSISKLTSAIKV